MSFCVQRCGRASVPPRIPDRRGDSALAASVSGACADSNQRANPHEVVRSVGEGEHPRHLLTPPVPQLAKHPDCLPPPEPFFHEFSFPLTDFVPRVARGSPIDRTAGSPGMNVLTDVRRDTGLPSRRDERGGVIAFVGADGPLDPWGFQPRQHLQRRVLLGVAPGGTHVRRDHQAVAVLRDHAAQIPQNRRGALALAGQPRLGIGGRAMGRVRALLPPEVHRRVLRVIVAAARRSRGDRAHALVTGPGFEQRAVDGEVLMREELPRVRLRQHPLEEGFRDVALQQPLPILREDRRDPHRIVRIQADKPAIQQIVVQLLHQLPLAPHGEEHLQQQRPQQLLRRNRGAAILRVQAGEPRRQIAENRLDQLTDHAQRVIRRDPIFHRARVRICFPWSFSWLQDWG